MSKTKILLYCLDAVGKNMAGPAIRYWEFAKALSQYYEVILSTPNVPDITSDDFLILPRKSHFSLEHLTLIDFLVIQHLSTKLVLKAKRAGIRIIYDAYAPGVFENMEVFNALPMHLQSYKSFVTLSHSNFALQMADSIICACSRQLDLWIGSLLALGRITPQLYHQDKTLKSFIDLVPFGISSNPPKKQGQGLRERFNIPKDANVILWGGGIWNWFDPLTVIQAVKNLIDQDFCVYLVFMGVKNPNDKVPAMKMAVDAQKLAKELGLLDKYVFFNYGWTPYEQRQNFLLEADIGISAHFDHLETKYAFRTRILDYIWAQLPIICTEGDSFAELIKQHRLGRVVPCENAKLLSSEIKALLENSEEIKMMKSNLEVIGKNFHWNEVVRPIIKMVEFQKNKPLPRLSGSDIKHMWYHLWGLNKPTTFYKRILQYQYKKKNSF